MREIKFKALTNCKIEVKGYYVYDEHLNLHYINTGRGVLVEIDRKTLRQYTGLKDKNGKEIYEGDILRSRTELLYLVKYNEYDAGFYAYDVFEGKIQNGINSLNRDIIKSYDLEVIGNIYENKELLEVK